MGETTSLPQRWAGKPTKTASATAERVATVWSETFSIAGGFEVPPELTALQHASCIVLTGMLQ